MVDIISTAYAMHQIQQIADGCNNIVYSNGTLFINESWGANHIQQVTLIIQLNLNDNSLAFAKNTLLLIIGNLINQILGNQLISWYYDLTSLLIYQWLSQNLAYQTMLPAQFLGNLMTANSSQIITLLIKEQAAEHRAGIIYVKWLALTKSLINLI